MQKKIKIKIKKKNLLPDSDNRISTGIDQLLYNWLTEYLIQFSKMKNRVPPILANNQDWVYTPSWWVASDGSW
jgi:hypothetical protein